ncbi:MAG: YheT family hydrolase [Planctomycetota bacterium]|jgi:predicted alpha/beta-fold hydrolase
MESRSYAPFYPHPLLRDRHVMTIAGSKLPRPLGPFLDLGEDLWIEVDTQTSVRVESHWQEDFGAPILILIHGLSGSSRSPYMSGTAQKAFHAGWSVLRLNIRNCGDTAEHTPTLYNAALTEDLQALVDWVGENHPRSPIGIAGFSLGGSILLHTAAGWEDRPPENVIGLCTVSTPLNLVSTSRQLHTGFMNRFYMKLFLDGFVKSMRRKAAEFPELYPHDASRGYKDFYTFDDQWTAPAFGFEGANDYYNKASAYRVLDRIQIPGLIIHSEDDPLVPYNDLSLVALEGNDRLRLLMTTYGGHNGFFAAEAAATDDWQDVDRWWAENRVVEYFTGLVEARGKKMVRAS